MIETIRQFLQESIEAKQKFLQSAEVEQIKAVSEHLIQSLEQGHKILICGNGGSASDALHFAAELVGRFEKNRNALPALSLNSDVASLTAIANDYGYEHVFERQVEALGTEGDCLIGISTSGNSENVILACKKAKEMGIKTIGLLGRDGGILKTITDTSIIIPENKTARIQELHIVIIHIICSIIENYFFN